MPINPSPDALVSAYNALMADRPFKTGRRITRSVGGLLDVEEAETRLPEEADVYRLAAQVEFYSRLYGGRIVGCHAAGGKWKPVHKREKGVE